MVRPFRFQPPSLPVDLIRRPELVLRLSHRWDRRVVTVVAGPGFGKTALLTAAIASAAGETTVRDVWLGCEPSDAEASRLVGGLTDALGIAGSHELATVTEHVWAQAPTSVCLMLDDVHEIPRGSSGAEVLTRLAADLPANGHLVFASREPVPLATARLAASEQLERIQEQDLVLSDDELGQLAHLRGVDRGLLAATGGWPALAELTARAGADLVLDFLWEEVLSAVGPDRARVLAGFALVGGGGDDLASAVADRPTRAADLVDGLPLVQRSAAGGAVLHALWLPALRRLIDDEEATTARRRAATAHLAAGRVGEAIDLMADAEAWEEVLALIREAAVDGSLNASPRDFAQWHDLLPERFRRRPGALLAKGLALRARASQEAVEVLGHAGESFREAGDVDAEVAAMAAAGLVCWLVNDLAGLVAIGRRVATIAAAGNGAAKNLDAIGSALVAHSAGDSPAVFASLDRVDLGALPAWRPVAEWFRSVALRRDGDVERSLEVLDFLHPSALGPMEAHIEQARLRSRWLAGEVDAVCEGLVALQERYAEMGDSLNRAGTAVELATRRAWLGLPTPPLNPDVRTSALADTGGAVVRTMTALAQAVIAIDAGNEAAAAGVLREPVMDTIRTPEGWYWRDRGAAALVHVLVPEAREVLEVQPLGPPHRAALHLAVVVEAARSGDLGPSGALRWPSPGVVRSSLPAPWVVELVVAGLAAGNPAPPALIDIIRPVLRSRLQHLVDETSARDPLGKTVRALLAETPALPPTPLEIRVLGSLELLRGGEPALDPRLRRQRVRELLLLLVIRRRARREEVAELLWPDGTAGANNLRVNLSHLQQVLQPERAHTDPPFFLRSDGDWLVLDTSGQLEVDSWTLDDLLDAADAAHRRGEPSTALAAYAQALPLWRGAPYADAPYSEWAEPERTRLQTRYSNAAVRAGELLLAVGATADARSAAQKALAADTFLEAGHQLLIRCLLAEGNLAAAHEAVNACRKALAELGLEPSSRTLALIDGPG